MVKEFLKDLFGHKKVFSPIYFFCEKNFGCEKVLGLKKNFRSKVLGLFLKIVKNKPTRPNLHDGWLCGPRQLFADAAVCDLAACPLLSL